mgnify:CR=1 FL=1
MADNRRISTGIPGLDRVTKGGFLSRHTYVLVGAPGTGKTILSLQWLLEGRKMGDKGVFISMVEEPAGLEQNVSGFGWNLDQIEVVDFSVAATSVVTDYDEYHVFPPSEVEYTPVWERICDIIEEKRPQRLVIDSITQLRQFSTDAYQFRRHLFSLLRFLVRLNCTTLLSCEPSAITQDSAISSAVDGIIYLEKEISPERLIDLRSIHIQKFRGSDFLAGTHPMRITSKGIEVFPHVIEPCKDVKLTGEMVMSDIPKLDELLGGGLESGTVTIFTGPSGTGKSTLAVHFLAQAARAGKQAALYAFEETKESVLRRSENFGMQLDPLLENGSLRIRYINPLQLYPDELLAMIRDETAGGGRDVVALDSLRGYHMAMDQFGSTVAHIQNLMHYLKSQRATILLVNETENITGDLRMTEAGISFLADNILLLRYVERRGKLARVIGCMKKRHGLSQSELREVTLSQTGFKIGEKLENLVGILSGVPTIREKNPGTKQRR